MNFLKLKLLDIYIIKKFLGTFFFAIVLIISIAVIFDFSEKIDNFMENNASFKDIMFWYYLNFIPYFAVLFSYLFVFISVIFFTAKMAYDTEIIAILSSGVSFSRFLWPYFISSLVITLVSFYLTNYIIPHATARRFAFEDQFYHKSKVYFNEQNVHKQIQPGVYIFMESYSNLSQIGREFSKEEFKDGKLTSKMLADFIKWDSVDKKWLARNYYIREIDNQKEHIKSGDELRLELNMRPEEFERRENFIETMNLTELNKYINKLKLEGSGNLEFALIEKYKRFSEPFSTFILALIGVCLSSRKMRGGMGMHIGIGLLISFSYILFMQFAKQFAIGGSIHPMFAVWIPNIIFAGIGSYLFFKANK